MKEILILIGREAIKSFTSFFIWLFKNRCPVLNSLFLEQIISTIRMNSQIKVYHLRSDLIDGPGLFPAAAEQNESSITHLDWYILKTS